MPGLWHASPIVTFSAFALPKLSCLPFFSPFKILKGLLPGRCLPVRGVLSCPRETLCFIVLREGFNRFLLVVGRHPKHQKTNACPEKGLLAQCLPVACPLPPSCLPASLGPAKMVWNALGKGSKGGKKVGWGGKRHPHQKNAHTIKPGVLVPLTASLEGDRATHTDEDGYRVLQILRSTLPRLDQTGESAS